jgi:hypothetical protein
MRVAVFLLFPAILPAADTLVLRSGPPVSGSYPGGDARSVRFIVGDQVKVYRVSDVVSIQFDNPTAKQPSSSSEGLRTPSEPGPPSTPEVADKQIKYCAVISDYRDALARYANEPNPIKGQGRRNPEKYTLSVCGPLEPPDDRRT